MPVKYVPYNPEPIEGQALLNNFQRLLRYRGDSEINDRISRGMPYYEVELQEKVGSVPNENLIFRGECVSTCAYLKDKGITVDLVYIDPPFASGADYAKKVYVRRNPKIAELINNAEDNFSESGYEIGMTDDFRAFEEKMYGDVWDKEKYLNWMYENLLAIKSIMSESASIYVHLDWHISHYIKIIMDEIFGEDNFRNEIIWHYSGWNKKLKSNFERRHDVLLFYSFDDDGTSFNSFFEQWESEEEYIRKRKQKTHQDRDGRRYVLSDAGGGKRVKRYVDEAIKDGVVVDDVWYIDKINNSAKEATGYSTQKPEELLERVILASSNEKMIVADFFGGSGVTAVVAQKLGRRFVTSDIGLNSIQTMRDRLYSIGASFSLYEIQDGVSLYRNPIQTMDKIKSLIPGLKNDDSLDSFWEGSFSDSRLGTVPVFVPNLLDSSSKLLDVVLMNQVIHQAIPELPNRVKKVVVFYIDISDEDVIRKFIDEDDSTTVEVELRDLKAVLSDVVMNDEIEYRIEKVQELLFPSEYQVIIDRFISDRVIQKILDFNQRSLEQTKGKQFKPILISDEGLETIEWLSLDCTASEGEWFSDTEIKIDKLGYTIINGVKTNKFWDGTISNEAKPLRLKVRNICGDESIFKLNYSE